MKSVLFQWNQDNVSEWSNMSTYEVLFQWNQDNVSEWSNMSIYEVWSNMFQWDNVSEWSNIRIMCQSGATCLPMKCCFSELALYKFNLVWWFCAKQT